MLRPNAPPTGLDEDQKCRFTSRGGKRPSDQPSLRFDTALVCYHPYAMEYMASKCKNMGLFTKGIFTNPPEITLILEKKYICQIQNPLYTYPKGYNRPQDNVGQEFSQTMHLVVQFAI